MAGTKFFGRIGSVFLRGFREIYLRSHLPADEWKAIKDHFDNRCCYCGIEDTGNPRTGLVPDHVVPAAHSGELVAGNVVPACHHCNDHRGAQEWEKYLRSTVAEPEAADRRAATIRAFLGASPYEAPSPEARLTPEQAARYRELEERFTSLLEDVRALHREVKRPDELPIVRRRRGPTS